jgi:hypothetical protein
METHARSETPKELLLEADRGVTESTPFIALTGVMMIVAVAVLAVLAIILIAIFVA